MAERLMQDPVLGELWELCVSVSVVIVLLLLIRPAMKRMPRIGMYILWVMVVLRIACPFPLSGMYEFMPVSVGQTIADVKRSTEQKHLLETARQKKMYGGPQNGYRLTSGDSPVRENGGKQKMEAKDESKGNEPSGVTPFPIRPEWIVLSIWLAGVMCCVIYLCRSLSRNRRHFRNAVHVYDNVYEHHDSCGSFVGGIFSPKIYVPAGTEGEALEYILVHENIHIRRWDYRIKPFAFLMFSALWFNPLVWVAYRLLITDMEVSCDEAVIRKMGSDCKKRYSYLLLTMASGENRVLRSHAAFGAGMVKERIHQVMKYKKPTKFMTAVLATVVLVCGCGIASSDPPRTSALPQGDVSKENTDAVYVEQAVNADIKWSDDDKIESNGGIMTVDRNGTFVMITELVTVPEERPVSFGKAVFESGAWNKADITWDQELIRLLDGKNCLLDNLFYGADNHLYLSFVEYSVPFSESEKYVGREEEWYEVWYLVDQLLFRIDEGTGEIVELDVPVVKKGDEILYNSYGFFADGNYFVQTEETFALYNSKTGEKVDDITPSQDWSTLGSLPQAGDDFIVSLIMNQQTNSFEISVQDELGRSSYVLQTGAKFDMEKEKIDGCAVGVSGGTILLATRDGIFEAEYGAEEFHRVIDAEKDNLYYLTPDNYEPVSGAVFWKGSDDDYMLSLAREGKGQSVSCYYSKFQ